MKKEVSAGGLVHRQGKILLVKVKNLKGEVVWTFPKGHLEKGETAKEAALREVLEETGYECELAGSLMEARYYFKRDEKLVDKRVKWFEMTPGKKVGQPDADEILATRWVGQAAADKILKYPSDKKLMKVFRSRC